MKIPSSVEIARLINTAVDGVDKSCFGPFFRSNPENINQKAVDQISFAVFNCVLANMLQKIDFDKQDDNNNNKAKMC